MFKRLEYFSKRNQLYLFTISDKREETQFRADLLNYCCDVKIYCREGRRLRSLSYLYKAPFVCVSRWFPTMKFDINHCYDEIDPDYVIVDFPQMLGNISDKIMASGKLVLNQHNTEYLTLRNLSYLFNNPIKRLIYEIESYRLMKYERNVYAKNVIKLFTFVSKEDKSFFESQYNLYNTLLVPVGTEIKVGARKEDGCFNITYVGKMEYPPNAEAAVWFADNVFSKIKAYISNVRFYVVGKRPLQSVCNLKVDKQIIVTGTVDNVDIYFDQSDVVVIPLFHGGGVKVKLLEALGHGNIVITTDKGLEGTNFQKNVDLLVANTADEFAELCIDVFNNPRKYDGIKQEALKRIKEEYTWDAIIENFESHLISNKN